MPLTTEPFATVRRFEAFAPDSDMGDITKSYVVTGVLPSKYGEHYDLEEALIKAGILERKHCDSESGQFFVYPPDEETCRKVLRFIEDRLARADAGPFA